jgi:hypothetical protein
VHGISAEVGNIFLLSKDLFKVYLKHKRFNQESKDNTIRSFHNELKYALSLVVAFKDLVDFIYGLLRLRSIADLDKDIRLSLHRYFNCEQTMVLSITTPHSLEEHTRIQGQTSRSRVFNLTYG